MAAAVAAVHQTRLLGGGDLVEDGPHGLKPESAEEIAAEEAASESSGRTWKYWFNLALTLVMLVFLFLDTPLPLYSIFMIAYAIALLVNFPQTKTQNKKIK